MCACRIRTTCWIRKSCLSNLSLFVAILVHVLDRRVAGIRKALHQFQGLPMILCQSFLWIKRVAQQLSIVVFICTLSSTTHPSQAQFQTEPSFQCLCVSTCRQVHLSFCDQRRCLGPLETLLTPMWASWVWPRKCRGPVGCPRVSQMAQHLHLRTWITVWICSVSNGNKHTQTPAFWHFTLGVLNPPIHCAASPVPVTTKMTLLGHSPLSYPQSVGTVWST